MLSGVPITAIVFSTSVCPNLCHTKNHVLHQCNSDTSKIRSLWLRQIRRLWLGISINRCLRHRINLECLWRHPAVPVCACAWRNLLLFIALQCSKGWSWTSKRSRPLIGPALMPLLTLVVMLPAAAAAIKQFLALYVGQVYWFVPVFSAKRLACQLWPMSSLFLFDVYEAGAIHVCF